VLTALSFLGWNAYPLGRLAGDGACERVTRDFERWGVKQEFLRLLPPAPTPVVIHRIRRGQSGEITHRFSLSCPECGRWLPTYKAVPAQAILESLPDLPKNEVCFIDRPSRGAIELAEHAAAQGALVYVEPSGQASRHLLRRLLQLADVVKYSDKNSDWIKDAWSREATPALIVETNGAKGLRYRTHRTDLWRRCPPFVVDTIADAAGAGDWTTAGIIHTLGQGGAHALDYLPEVVIREGIQFGQALGAWACAFEGSRGGMYAQGKRAFRKAVRGIIDGSDRKNGSVVQNQFSAQEAASVVCRKCNETQGSITSVVGYSDQYAPTS
jgi:fructokinase